MKVYADNAATTPLCKAALETLNDISSRVYGNPSSIHWAGQEASTVLDEARATIAGLLGAKAKEIYFTSGGTEADNWAIIAAAEAYQGKGKHIITSSIEHHAVLHTCEYLQKQRGYEVTYVDVDADGILNLDELKAAIRPDTILISVMFANNEIGTVQPIKEIGQIAKEHGILFHTDAVQAYCQLPIDVDKLNIDMMSASAHKLRGPKGIGFLYIRKGVKIKSFIHGGAQERKRRAGTENVPGIVGFGKAVEVAMATMYERARDEKELRDHLITRVTTEIEHVRLNGSWEQRLPGNANFSFRFVESESLLLDLIGKGVYASSGSACTTKSLDPSHVLLACGISHERANGSLRMTLNEQNTKEEIDYTVDCLKDIVKRIRSMSPLYEDYIKKQAKGAQANV